MSDSIFAENIKLKNIQQTLEKATNTIWRNLKKNSDYCDITEIFDAQDHCEFEKENIQIIIKDIFDEINAKKNLLKDDKVVNITDFQQFKKEMIGIQDHIQNFKLQVKTKLETLSKENFDLMDDIEFYSERLFEWAEPVNFNICNPNSYVPKKIMRKHQCKEMLDFMDFIRNSNGHENGWTKDDHQLFVKLRQKYKKTDIIVEKLHEILPDLSTEDINKHNEWYTQYLHLKNCKKDAIKAWQNSKNNKNMNKYETLKTNYSVKFIPCGDSVATIQEKLKKWKSERDSQIQLARDIDTLKLKKEKEKEELRKKHNEELKKIVLEWKQTKTELEQKQLQCRKVNEQEDKRKKAFEAKKMIKEFQTQDDMYVMKMLKQRQRKELKVPVRSKSSQLATRDPNRLLKPTKQWINRVHDDNVYDTGVGTSLKTLPKLGVPQWRKQL